MPFNASGYYERTYSWAADKNATPAIPIKADRMDTETDGIVDAINQVIAGTVSWKGPFAGVYGTAGMPAYSFADDSDTGFYREAADVLGLSAGGTKIAEISAVGFAVTGDVTATNVAASGAVNAASLSVSGNVTGVTKTHVGLGNADNTADADKPVSTATQAALDLKADAADLNNVDNTSDANKPISTSTQIALDLKAATTYVDAQVSSALMPSGAVLYFAMSSVPEGWLKANGAAVSRTTYAALFAAIGTTFGTGDGSTTFNLPDLRGEFMRGYDDGRGVDSGRVFGSNQSHAFTNHRHHVASSASGGVVYPNTNVTANNFVSWGYSGGGYERYILTAVGSDANIGLSSYAISGSGSETRPRNLALLACIKV